MHIDLDHDAVMAKYNGAAPDAKAIVQDLCRTGARGFSLPSSYKNGLIKPVYDAHQKISWPADVHEKTNACRSAPQRRGTSE